MLLYTLIKTVTLWLGKKKVWRICVICCSGLPDRNRGTCWAQLWTPARRGWGRGRKSKTGLQQKTSSIINTHNFLALVIHLSSVQCFTCRKYICNFAWRSGYCSMTSRSILLITFLHPFSSFSLMSRSSKVSSVVFLVDRISFVSLEDWSERNSIKLIKGVSWLAQIDVLLQSLSLRKRKSKWHIGLLIFHLCFFPLSNSFTLFCNPV